MNGWCKALSLGVLLIGFAFKPVRAENWGSTTASDLGITQAEFTKVKEAGMPKAKLLRLLEIGVRPDEYFGEPWKKLGVTENYWLSERKQGFDDEEVNASFREQPSGAFNSFLFFVLPGYYHFQTHRPYAGALLSTLAVGGVSLWAIDGGKKIPVAIPAGLIATSLIWSAADAFIHTRFADNQDAKRFTLNFAPTSLQGGKIQLALRF